ncbi:hypothetical protein ArsFIN_00330 [Arsenophonus nasoniae]|uniref:Uncharacterized protein n=1 Tax=Arsenophonus nasoniae TaxID=638 RepID=A0A4P7KNQ1_9GAMM|nr:hypothetical protein ArsFIN_00330 [Arsenophonus nasoniae]
MLAKNLIATGKYFYSIKLAIPNKAQNMAYCYLFAIYLVKPNKITINLDSTALLTKAESIFRH